jgi:hypothetical protein
MSSLLNVTFTRDLLGYLLLARNALLERLHNVGLVHGYALFRWNLHRNGMLPVKLLYQVVIHVDEQSIIIKKWKMKPHISIIWAI